MAGAWESSRPTSTATAGPTCSSPTTRRPIISSATWAASDSPSKARSRAWRPTRRGGYLAGMGVACGDLDGDGRLDLAVTNFYGESTTLYHNHGGGLFSDRTAAAGLAAPTRFVLGFGLAALDANNDGRLDLAQANGHIGDYRPAIPYAMPAQLFLGDGTGKLIDVSDRAGPPWQLPRLARGLATGDLDNDGRIDVVLVSGNRPARLLAQPARRKARIRHRPGHFLMLDTGRDGLEPATPSARE